MDLMKKTIHMDQVRCSADAQTTVEDDINITDSKPDAYQLVTERGKVEVEEVRAMEDHVHIKGSLKFWVLYISDEEIRRPACMEGSLPFEEQVYLNGVNSSDAVTVRAVLEDLNVGMINSRKLSVQALVDFGLCVETVEEMEAAVGIDGEEGVEMKTTPLQALDLVIAKKDIFRVRQDVELPAGMPNLFEILWQTCELKEMTCRAQDGKLALEGEISLFVLYEGEGEERPAVWYETTVPVKGAVDCQGMREGMLEKIRFGIGHQEIEGKADADGEERKISLELVLDLDMKLYEEVRMETVSDLYGVEQEMEAVRCMGRCKQLVTKNTGKAKVSGRLQAGAGLPKIQQICGSFGEVWLGAIEPCPEGLKLTGTVSARILYASQDPDLPFCCLKDSLPFSYVMEVPQACEDCRYEVEPALEELRVSVADSGEAEVKAMVSFRGMVCEMHEEPMVTAVNVSQLDPEKLAALPGIVVYIAQDGDSLWSIGKKYYVPVARIKEMNDLASEEVKRGDKILVVKG